jgi:uncharacterized protein YhfF
VQERGPLTCPNTVFRTCRSENFEIFWNSQAAACTVVWVSQFADELLAFVLAGAKRATCPSHASWQADITIMPGHRLAALARAEPHCVLLSTSFAVNMDRLRAQSGDVVRAG